jgi:hypothetical protein
VARCLLSVLATKASYHAPDCRHKIKQSVGSDKPSEQRTALSQTQAQAASQQLLPPVAPLRRCVSNGSVRSIRDIFSSKGQLR